MSKPFWDALGGALGGSSSIKTPLERRGVAGRGPHRAARGSGAGRELAQGKGSGEGAQVSAGQVGLASCLDPGHGSTLGLEAAGGFTGGREGWQEKGWWAPPPGGRGAGGEAGAQRHQRPSCCSSLLQAPARIHQSVSQTAGRTEAPGRGRGPSHPEGLRRSTLGPGQGQATASDAEKPHSLSWAAVSRDTPCRVVEAPYTAPLGSPLRGGVLGLGTPVGNLAASSLGRPACRGGFWASLEDCRRPPLAPRAPLLLAGSPPLSRHRQPLAVPSRQPWGPFALRGLELPPSLPRVPSPPRAQTARRPGGGVGVLGDG